MFFAKKHRGAAGGVRRGVLLLVLLALMAPLVLAGCSRGRNRYEDHRGGSRHHRESRDYDRDHGRGHDDCGGSRRDDCDD